MFCNEQLASVRKNNDEMRELLGIHDVSIGHLSGIVMGSEQPMHKKIVSIGLYPGVARGAWKHAPIIPLPRHDALLRAHPPYFQTNQRHPCG